MFGFLWNVENFKQRRRITSSDFFKIVVWKVVIWSYCNCNAPPLPFVSKGQELIKIHKGGRTLYYAAVIKKLIYRKLFCCCDLCHQYANILTNLPTDCHRSWMDVCLVFLQRQTMIPRWLAPRETCSCRYRSCADGVGQVPTWFCRIPVHTHTL